MGNANMKITRHPLTREVIRPLGFRSDGRPIYPIMGGDDTVPPAAPPATPPATPPAAPAANPAPPAPGAPVNPDAGKTPPWGKPEDFDPEKAWSLIQSLRAEKSDPTMVADLTKRLEQVEADKQAQADAIARALGIKPDDAPADPEKLTAQLVDEQARTREAAVQLAVYRSAAAAEANPDVLLDSASFLASIKDVDPTDQAAVTAAIQKAVEANPRFKAAPAAANTTPPFPGGPRTPAAPQRAGTLGEAIRNKVAAGTTR